MLMLMLAILGLNSLARTPFLRFSFKVGSLEGSYIIVFTWLVVSWICWRAFLSELQLLGLHVGFKGCWVAMCSLECGCELMWNRFLIEKQISHLHSTTSLTFRYVRFTFERCSPTLECKLCCVVVHLGTKPILLCKPRILLMPLIFWCLHYIKFCHPVPEV